MLSVTSPISYPPSSPAPPKRPNPHATNGGQRKSRIKGGFMVDDGSDDSNDSDNPDVIAEPAAKRRRLSRNHPQYDRDIDDAASFAADATHVQSANSARDSQEYVMVDSQPAMQDSASPYSPLNIFTGQSKFLTARTCSGRTLTISQREATATTSYERMVAARTKTKESRASRAYYGIEIHRLIDAAKAAAATVASTKNKLHVSKPQAHDSIEQDAKPRRTLLWTEKYRARSFMDLCGDDGTNRLVLHWLKKWDPVVFPAIARSRPPGRRTTTNQPVTEEKPHRKILLLAGPPGLGKTTLAHVCARQAGYEVLEINASDDRSSDVVQNRIRTSLGTETVKTVANQKGGDGIQAKIARPVCVVVDEVDGAVSGAGGSGEGGFVKALIDLVMLDQKNSGAAVSHTTGRRKKKHDSFRLGRPLILICNDIYHASLRPLRHSGLAEIIHVGKPSLEAVVGRLAGVFEKEGIPCDMDAARKLCEAAWGRGTGPNARRDAESGLEGDLRSVMVVGEWVAGRLRAASSRSPRLTRQWIEANIFQGLSRGACGSRGLGRGGSRDIVNRIFMDGGGFPKQAAAPIADSDRVYDHEQPKTQLGFSEHQMRHAMEQLRQMIETSGETDRIMTDLFTEYPNREYNDDSFLSKPTMAYEWLHFYDACSARLFGSSTDWELFPYLSQSALAHHLIFATSSRHVPANYDRQWGSAMDTDGAVSVPPLPFSGPRASYLAHEAEKEMRAQLQALQAQLPPSLGRSFRSPEALAVDLMPYLLKIVSPDVKPVVVGGSQMATATVRRDGERRMVKRAAEIMADIGIQVHSGHIESDSAVSRPQFVYRLDPDLDALCQFETAPTGLPTSQGPTRYAVRQVLRQELRRVIGQRESEARQARFRTGARPDETLESVVPHPSQKPSPKQQQQQQTGAPAPRIKRDFFGNVMAERSFVAPGEKLAAAGNGSIRSSGSAVWVTYNEGLNNAVRKPISFDEFMKGF